MENRMIIAGFGGQGVLMTGQLLCYAAILNGKNAIFLPKYGAEQRGGTAKCDVTISDERIFSPFVRNVDVLIAFNQPSLEKYISEVKPGGVVLMNADQCSSKPDRSDTTFYEIPVDTIAEKLGSRKVANIVMLGAYSRITGRLTEDEVLTAIEAKLAKKPQYMDMNRRALAEGILAAQK